MKDQQQFHGLHLKMFRFWIICHVLFLHTVLIICSGNSSVIQLSVLEDQRLCLQRGGPDESSSDVVWTHRDREVLVTRQGSYETSRDRQRYVLRPDGGLCLLRLEDSDSGTFHCNQQLVAELHVLSGLDFSVPAGRTLLLPCSGSSKPKRRWSHRREGGRLEAVLTRFRNGTAKSERSRISLSNDALQIQDLQPEDAGEYVCNGELQARLSVLTREQPEPTSIQPTTASAVTSPATQTDVLDVKKKEKRKPETALLLVAVVGLGLMILLLAAVCVLLTSMKCRRRRKLRRAAARHEDTELQPWTTQMDKQTEREECESAALQEETIHYASLGRQNWRERPCRTPPDQDRHDVIYSSVVTRPARLKRTALQPAAL